MPKFLSKLLLLSMITVGNRVYAAAMETAEQKAIRAAEQTADQIYRRNNLGTIADAYNGSQWAAIKARFCCTGADPIPTLRQAYHDSTLSETDKALARRLAAEIYGNTVVRNELTEIGNYNPGFMRRIGGAIATGAKKAGSVAVSAFDAAGGLEGVADVLETAAAATAQGPQIAGTLHNAGRTIAGNVTGTFSAITGRSKSTSPNSKKDN